MSTNCQDLIVLFGKSLKYLENKIEFINHGKRGFMLYNIDDYDLNKEPCFISQRKSNLPKNITNDTCIVDITGELNLYSAREMQEFFDSLIKSGYKKICLDLSKLQYIDSSCLGVFLKSHVLLSKSGGHLRLISPSKEMTSIFQLTKLDKMLLIFESAEKAIS